MGGLESRPFLLSERKPLTRARRRGKIHLSNIGPKEKAMTTDKPEIIKALVPLSRILEDHDIQIRGEINSAVVKEYEAIVRETGRMDSITLFYDGEFDHAATTFMIGDGWHRIAAYRGAGLVKINANLRQGTRSEAIEYALRRNGHHGAPMSKAQKRSATEIAVKDARIGELTDSKIARMVGVSQSLVSLVRRGISPEAATERVNGSKAKRAVNKASKPDASPAPAPERPAPPPPDPTPTKSRLLNQLYTHISSGVIDELDVIKTLNTPSGSYVLLPNPGSDMTLRVVGANGRVQFEGVVTLKDISFEEVCVKYAAGKLVDSVS